MSVVKRLAKRGCGDSARFSDEAAEALALHLQRVAHDAGIAAWNLARVDGRKTVQPQDIEAALAAAQPSGRRREAPGSLAEQALARANLKLPPEKREYLGRFRPSEGGA